MTLSRKTPLAKVSKRPVKCKACGERFVRERLGEKCCTIKCAIDYGKAELQKKQKAWISQERKKQRASSISWWHKQAQREMNKWIRLVRDNGKPCISCDRPLPAGKSILKESGHFKTRGSNSALRYDEVNLNAQCHRCNHHLSGNVARYRDGIVKRYGKAEAERLDNAERVRKWTIPEVKAIRDKYRKLNKEAGV